MLRARLPLLLAVALAWSGAAHAQSSPASCIATDEYGWVEIVDPARDVRWRITWSGGPTLVLETSGTETRSWSLSASERDPFLRRLARALTLDRQGCIIMSRPPVLRVGWACSGDPQDGAFGASYRVIANCEDGEGTSSDVLAAIEETLPDRTPGWAKVAKVLAPAVGAFALLLALQRWLFRRRFGGGPLSKQAREQANRFDSLRAHGHLADALDAIEPFLLEVAPARCSWPLLNTILCDDITVGRYGHALGLAARFGDAARDAARRGAPEPHVLFRINEAEALYNVGRWRDALDLLDVVFAEADQFPLTGAGVRLQRAWVLARLGEAARARAALEGLNRDAIPLEYQAEIEFTLAAIHACAGEYAEAQLAVDRGLECAVRPSSRRNALFLRGRFAAEAGDLDTARTAFAEGLEHAYRGQGGWELFRWGEILHAHGEVAEAERIWRLCCDRDPESEGAARARERLSSAA